MTNIVRLAACLALFAIFPARAGDSTEVAISKIELHGMGDEHLVVKATTERIVSIEFAVKGRAIEIPKDAFSQPIAPALSQTRLLDCSDRDYSELRECYVLEISVAYQPTSPVPKFGLIRFEMRNGSLRKSEIEVEEEEGGRHFVVWRRNF